MAGLKRVISGGQTGVDQAALRAARASGLEIGGWCPPGRESEAGVIPSGFPLQETPMDRSPQAPDIPRSQRTEWNVRDSDATLILRPPSVVEDPGTDWTAHCAADLGHPLLVVDPWHPEACVQIREWLLGSLEIETLNVAGPSESGAPGIGERVEELLGRVFAEK
jgi:Circularly permutated YpsA SLOG family